MMSGATRRATAMSSLSLSVCSIAESLWAVATVKKTTCDLQITSN